VTAPSRATPNSSARTGGRQRDESAIPAAHRDRENDHREIGSSGEPQRKARRQQQVARLVEANRTHPIGYRTQPEAASHTGATDDANQRGARNLTRAMIVRERRQIDEPYAQRHRG